MQLTKKDKTTLDQMRKIGAWVEDVEASGGLEAILYAHGPRATEQAVTTDDANDGEGDRGPSQGQPRQQAAAVPGVHPWNAEAASTPQDQTGSNIPQAANSRPCPRPASIPVPGSTGHHSHEHQAAATTWNAEEGAHGRQQLPNKRHKANSCAPSTSARGGGRGGGGAAAGTEAFPEQPRSTKGRKHVKSNNTANPSQTTRQSSRPDNHDAAHASADRSNDDMSTTGSSPSS